MVKFEEVSSFSEFEKLITQEAKSNEPTYVLFFAGPSNKESWCPDCNKGIVLICLHLYYGNLNLYAMSFICTVYFFQPNLSSIKLSMPKPPKMQPSST